MCISSLDLLTQIQNKIGNILEKVSYFLPLWTLCLELFLLAWLYHRCTGFSSFCRVIFVVVCLLLYILLRAEELYKTLSKYCSAFLCKIKDVSLKLAALFFCFSLCPQPSQQEVGQQWWEMESWRCGWRAGSLLCGDGEEMGREIAVRNYSWFLLFFHYHVFIKATQIPIHKKYFYGIYNKVNNIVLHSVLWKLLDADVFVEFCL